MKAKLTLSLDEKLILKAKRYAKSRGMTISEIIAEYIETLEESPTSRRSAVIDEVETITPIAKSLRGIMKSKKISTVDYKKYLSDKN